jgi:hypothetical protein
VLACENANDQRSANLALWEFLLTSSEQQHPENTAQTEAFRSWVHVLYRAHDCTDLSKTYTIPPPPDLPTQSPTG